MAGKKGRSGRKKKNAAPKPAPEAAAVIPPAAPVKQEAVVQTAGDPFLSIEADLKTKLPPPVAGAEGSQPVKKAPENLVRFLWKGFYRIEDTGARNYLGLGGEYAGLFVPAENVLESHVKPSCELLEKYVPTDFLNKIDENMPEISLGIAFLEAQLGFFSKLQQAKAEMERKKAPQGGNSPQNQTEKVVYPSPDDLRRP